MHTSSVSAAGDGHKIIISSVLWHFIITYVIKELDLKQFDNLGLDIKASHNNYNTVINNQLTSKGIKLQA